jgi:S-formylglutathione hydrolase FrmB
MTLLQTTRYSAALNKQTSVNILLPDGAGRHRVMLLLHGYSDDQTVWLRRTRIEVDAERANVMVVMPDGGHGFYTDAEEGYAYGAAIGVELPKFIEQTFRVQPHFAVTGLSMGGYGAVRLALRYPARFRSAVSHSGALMWGNDAQRDRPGRPWEYVHLVGESPRGSAHDLVALAERCPVEARPSLRIDCGTEDFLLPDNRAYHAALEAMGYDHEYQEFPGDHNWDYWNEHVAEALAFHERVGYR